LSRCRRYLDHEFAGGVARQEELQRLRSAFNNAAILNQNNTYGSSTVISPQGAWLLPTQVLLPRFFKLGARIDF
jgi:hypothetical protein